MAPQVGLEPTTLRLTAGCSAIELLRSVCLGMRPKGASPFVVDIHNIIGGGWWKLSGVGFLGVGYDRSLAGYDG